MADPFPIYQQVVKDDKAFFRDVHGYVPLSNTKTGLAGVRSRVYTELWRDKVSPKAPQSKKRKGSSVRAVVKRARK